MSALISAPEQLYLRTLHKLLALKIEFCVTGTYALRLYYPALAQRPIADCDLLLPDDPAQLNRVVAYLQAAGWQVSLWDVPVQLPLMAAQLAGKFYLRARQGEAVLDCCYENERFSWLEFAALIQWRQGLPLADAGQILLLKAGRNSPADREVLRLCQAAARS